MPLNSSAPSALSPVEDEVSITIDCSSPLASSIPSQPSESTAQPSILSQEHLQLHQHQLHKQPVLPICTALPLCNNSNNDDDDSPTTVTAARVTEAHPNVAWPSPAIAGSSTQTTFFNSNLFTEDPLSRSNYEDKHNINGVSTNVNNNTTISIPGPYPQREPEENLCRHPSKVQGSFYTRFFRLESPETRTKVIVRSSWLPTSALFLVRFILFLYTASVLIVDLITTERPRYSFCYLTQLSYLGLTSYLGTVSWHTLSEWRRERAIRALENTAVSSASSSSSALSHNETTVAAVEEGLAMPNPTWTTTIERQHWLLTDMNFFLYHTICTFHLIVPFIYWGFLAYSGEAKMMAVDVSTVSLWLNYSFHGGDLIIVLFEIAINTMSFIPSHFVIVFFICLLYLAETHVVYYVDGFWIYPFLDTTGGPIWVLLYFGVGCAILVAFTFMYYLHRIRNACRAKCHRSSIVGSSMLQQQQNQQPSQQIFPPPSSQLENTDTSISRPGHDSPFTIRQFTRLIQTKVQNRKRSCSNTSQESTASTLVGSDDPILSKTKDVSCINGPSPIHSDETLEIVEEVENNIRVLDQEKDSTQA